LPAFLYCHLETYPIPGTPVLFPFEASPEAESYARELAMGELSRHARFLIYGGDVNVHRWQKFFANLPAMRSWQSRRVGHLGDVDVVVFFRSPDYATAGTKASE
jgi:hypothetical protein